MNLGKSYKENDVSKYANLGGFRDVFAAKLCVVASFEHPELNTGFFFMIRQKFLNLHNLNLKNRSKQTISKILGRTPSPINRR